MPKEESSQTREVRDKMKHATGKFYRIALCLVLTAFLVTSGAAAGIDIDVNTPSMEEYDWYYDSVTHTLILDNANLQYICADGINLDIKLIGKNTVSGGKEITDSAGNSCLCGIYLNGGTLEILEQSDGSLYVTVDGTKTEDVSVKGILTEGTNSDFFVRGGTLVVNADGNVDVSAVQAQGTFLVTGGLVDVTANGFGSKGNAAGVFASTQVRENGNLVVTVFSDAASRGICADAFYLKENGKATVYAYGDFAKGISACYTIEIYSNSAELMVSSSGTAAYGLYLEPSETPGVSDIYINGKNTFITGDTRAISVNAGNLIVHPSQTIKAAGNINGTGAKTVTGSELRDSYEYQYVKITPKWIENLPFAVGGMTVVLLLLAGLVVFAVKKRKNR